MTPRNILFLIACLFVFLALLLVYNGFYKSAAMNTANTAVIVAPS